MATTRKRTAPPLRTERVPLLLTAAEREAFEAAAAATHETLSAWMRRACHEAARRAS